MCGSPEAFSGGFLGLPPGWGAPRAGGSRPAPGEGGFSLAKRLVTALLAAGAIVALAAASSAAEPPLGALKGRITDTQNKPVPGALVYGTSPSLLGRKTVIATKYGNFALSHLPPGTYRVTVEAPGFKTVILDGIVVEGSRTYVLPFRLAASENEEEATELRPSPTLAARSTETSVVFDSEIVKRLPVGRDFSAVLRLAPGVIAEDASPVAALSVQGSPVNANVFLVDGIDLTNPRTAAPLGTIDIDAVDQVEISTAGHPVANADARGGYISVLARPGSDPRAGALSFLYSGASLASDLWSKSDRTAAGLPAPALDRNLYDGSLTLAGPVLADRAWYFAGFRLLNREREAPFRPWTDPRGRANSGYSWSSTELSGLFKLSAQVGDIVHARLEAGYIDRDQNVAESGLTLFRPLSATLALKHAGLFYAGAGLDYILNGETFISLQGGLTDASEPLRMSAAGASSASFVDLGTGRMWGSGEPNRQSDRGRITVAGSITRQQERVLGADHELKAGADFETGTASDSEWKADDLTVYYLFGSPYYYGLAASPTTGNTAGKGNIAFGLTSGDRNHFVVRQESRRFGGFIQDAMTFGGRVTLDLGLRFDHSLARLPGFSKSAAGNDLAVQAGKDLVFPLIGVNPFDAGSLATWESPITWNALSPRAGIVIDPFGTGRTLLRASYASYADVLSLAYPKALQTVAPERSHGFAWYDENMDGVVNTGDSFGLLADDYRIYLASYFKKRVDPDLAPPRTREVAVGLQQELLKDVSLSLTYIDKKQTDILGTVLYDPDTDRAWSQAGQGDGWWVPFSTVLPAAGDYPATPATVYFRSNQAPRVFERLQNVPELSRTYRAWELVLRKRMSANWQFYGSAVLAEARGNVGLGSAWAWGLFETPLTPNTYANLASDLPLDLDRRFSLRLLGTYRFPWRIDLTLLFTHDSGAPLARAITVFAPTEWAAENGVDGLPVTINLAVASSLRTEATNSLDARLEKEFSLGGKRRLLLAAEGVNVLGRKNRILDLDDAGAWYPAAEGTDQGVRVVSPTFDAVTALLGTRSVRFNLILKF